MQGWQCPQCGYIYSPTQPFCINCNRPENEKHKFTITTTTNNEKITYVPFDPNTSKEGK